MPMTNQTMNQLGKRGQRRRFKPTRFRMDLTAQRGMIRFSACARSSVGEAASSAASLPRFSILSLSAGWGCEKTHHGRRLSFCHRQWTVLPLNGVNELFDQRSRRADVHNVNLAEPRLGGGFQEA